MQVYDNNVLMRLGNDNFTVSMSRQGKSAIAGEEGNVPIIAIASHEPKGNYTKQFKLNLQTLRCNITGIVAASRYIQS